MFFNTFSKPRYQLKREVFPLSIFRDEQTGYWTQRYKDNFWKNFQLLLQKTMFNFFVSAIYNIIKTMNKRILVIIKNKDKRLKY